MLAILLGAGVLATAAAALVPAARREASAGVSDLVAIAGALRVPQAIDWDAKNAHAKCDLAIDGWLSWPPRADDACAAMRMCANEASLSAERDRRLRARVRTTPGCEAL